MIATLTKLFTPSEKENGASDSSGSCCATSAGITQRASADNASTGQRLLIGTVLVAILVATFLCYKSVLVNAFLSDDYLHVSWLREAVQRPELIVRNFHSSWLEGTAAKFYRPLISIFMVTDYLSYGTNAVGFHLTNIAFHLFSTALVFLICRSLIEPIQQGRGSSILWALCSAAIFGLCPLHVEAVSWITGRVDSVVTAFVLGSTWCYLRWRSTASRGWLVAAITSFVLGLMSKEMAVTLPPVLVILELLALAATRNVEKPFTRLKQTLPFWLTLAAYFGLRRVALGTFIGGYDDSLSALNLPLLIENWKHGLFKFMVPVNTELVASNDFARLVLEKSWLVLLAAFAAVCSSNRYRLRLGLFLCAWITLSLIPVYKIFWISENLEGSRLAYLATAPLAMALAFGLCGLSFEGLKGRILLGVQILLATLFCYSEARVLTVNNRAWAEAGKQMVAIQTGLRQIYSRIPGDPQVIFMGLPDSYCGAYIARNALAGVTHYPIIQRDIMNAVIVDRYEPISPYCYWRGWLERSKVATYAYRWDPDKKDFFAAPMPQLASSHSNYIYAGEKLARVLEPVAQDGVTFERLPNGGLKIESKAGVRPQIVLSDETVPPASWEFLRVGITASKQLPSSQDVDLLYSTDLSHYFRWDKKLHFVLPQKAGQAELLIGTRCLPEWTFSGHPAKLDLVLPSGWNGTIDSLVHVIPDQVLPRISADRSGLMAAQGYAKVSRVNRLATIGYDVSLIPDAVTSCLEIAPNNVWFEEQNSGKFSQLACRVITGKLKGSYVINRNDFGATGMYQARVWALDKNGKPLGVCSDHVVITVEPG